LRRLGNLSGEVVPGRVHVRGGQQPGEFGGVLGSAPVRHHQAQQPGPFARQVALRQGQRARGQAAVEQIVFPGSQKQLARQVSRGSGQRGIVRRVVFQLRGPGAGKLGRVGQMPLADRALEQRVQQGRGRMGHQQRPGAERGGRRVSLRIRCAGSLGHDNPARRARGLLAPLRTACPRLTGIRFVVMVMRHRADRARAIRPRAVPGRAATVYPKTA